MNHRLLALVLAAALAVVLTPHAAFAQSVPPDCGGGTTGGQPSRVSDKGPYGIGETGVVELDSAVDGKKIQIAYVRPDAPASYRSPVIVEAGSYFETDLREDDPTTCSSFLVENFVQHGYTVAFVPSRGAGGTDSCADLFGAKEVSDLDKAVTWLGEQPWSNGNVGMTGLSYHGSTPWDVASTGNPHLKTIVPGSGVHSLWDLVFYRGRNDWRWWFFVEGYYDYYGILFSNPGSSGRDADRWAAALNCDNHDEGLQASAESYESGEYDSLGYWAERDHDAAILDNYRGTVMLVQGLQDWNVDPGSQYPFINQLEDRGVYVKHLLGQWNHAWPDGDVGARSDYADVLLRWWNRWLKEDASVDTGPRAEVQDSDLKWRAEDAWPPKDSTPRTLFLNSDKTLSEQPSAETATATLGPGSRNRYFFLSGVGEEYNDLPVDHTCVLCATFTYTVQGGDLRLVGIPELNLSLVPSGSSGHVAAYLFRVDSDDAWHFVGWGASDLRFPQGETKAQPVVPGTPIEMNLPLQPLDAVVHDGEQLMIVLDQGNADHMPGVPFFPVDLQYGADRGTFRFDQRAGQ